MSPLTAWAVPFTPALPYQAVRLRAHPQVFAPSRRSLCPQACDVPPTTTIEVPETVESSDYGTSFRLAKAPSRAPAKRMPRRVPSTRNEPPKTDVPGPEPLPVVGNALDIVGSSLSDLMLRYALQNGPFVKFSICSDVLYLASDPVDIQRITTSNSKNYLDRWTPPGFEILLYDGKLRGLVFSQGRYWMQHRQVVGSVFRSPDFLSHYVDTTIEKTRFMIDRLWPQKLAPTITNVHQEMRMLTLDIIGAAAFGTEFGAMTSPGGAHEIETALSNILHGVMDVIKAPVPLWRFMRTPGRAAINEDLQRLHRIELELIHDRRRRLHAAGNQKHEMGKKDLLGLLLRAHDSDRSANFKDDDLMWDVHDVIFAGHETTASALAATLFLVAGSPRVLRKIREELAEVLPDNRDPLFEDITKLKYLDMVLKEALRLYPPTALIGRCAKAEDVLGGYRVPAGANVLISPYVMGRLERLWDNPNEFRPERFSPEESAGRHPMTHTPFGAGPRVCLGARMATMEAKVVLAMIFQRYSFELTVNELVADYDSTVSFRSGMDMVIRQNS